LDISIIIVNWNSKDLLLNCLGSIFKTVHGICFEIWLVDNASTDGSVESVQTLYPDLYIIKNETNLGFAAANNLAFRKMNGRYALLLNTDTVLTEDAVKKLYDFMESTPQAGLACGQLLNQDDSRQNSIANFPSLLSLLCNETLLRILFPRKFPSKRQIHVSPVEIDSCIGACMMARKQAMDEVGLFDERYFFFFEETDWARRMKDSGWKVYFVPDAQIYHSQGQTIGHGTHSRMIFYRSRYSYFRKWYPRGHLLFFTIIFIRLLAETLFSLLGLIATLGLNQGIRSKFIVYFNLILWHLRRCPSHA
jgi:GT2 family glycosyltransferase